MQHRPSSPVRSTCGRCNLRTVMHRRGVSSAEDLLGDWMCCAVRGRRLWNDTPGGTSPGHSRHIKKLIIPPSPSSTFPLALNPYRDGRLRYARRWPEGWEAQCRADAGPRGRAYTTTTDLGWAGLDLDGLDLDGTGWDGMGGCNGHDVCDVI